jgi:hypothetical protein
MKKSQLISVGVGVAVVVLAYAAYETFKGPAKAGAGGSGQLGAVNPGGASGLGFQPANPGQFLSTDELIYDAATRGPYDTYVFTDDLISNLTGGKPRSVMGELSGWWNGR